LFKFFVAYYIPGAISDFEVIEDEHDDLIYDLIRDLICDPFNLDA